MKIVFGEHHYEVEIKPQESILDVCLQNDIPIEHICGGNAACTSCKVKIISGGDIVSKKNTDEEFLLHSVNLIGDEIRLACQCKLKVEDHDSLLIQVLND
ncbi:MAG: 2Fe-2S iron-sulfur cluster-binding protein [Ignavibacteria bacterium]